jgi:ABC-type polysaccharide/polyol phosphate transport system ATPase subunit
VSVSTSLAAKVPSARGDSGHLGRGSLRVVENIRLGGLAVGIPAERLAKLTDVIAEFAQLDEYIDFPLWT